MGKNLLKDSLKNKLGDLLDENVLERGLAILDDQLAPLKHLFDQRAVPEDGWTDAQVKALFDLLSNMDTDKDPLAARVGEREARTASDYVLSLAAGFAHGIGRSGEIAAVQPKAPGGSILNALAGRLATNLLRNIGLPAIESSIVLPLATGMSVGLCLAAIHHDWTVGGNGNAWARDEVIVPRVDHASPLKGLRLAGFTPVIIEGMLDGDAVTVPVDAIRDAISPRTAAILSTTAFFPPRMPDHVKEIAKLCSDENLPHVINNSYGVQNEVYLKSLRGAIDAGRVDYIVQSTDKNFLTPVGGAVVCSPSAERIAAASSAYAGRATAQPLVQFVAAVLVMGLNGYKALMAEQRKNRSYLQEQLEHIAGDHGQRLLQVENPIAAAMTLEDFPKKIGGMLYALRVTGPRVVFPGEFGSCTDAYPTPYMTVNAGIGAKRRDFELLLDRLETLFTQLGND
jgi:O-phospho-L-seryl-tRNASec:L-selenocysteinyl-tRNA synthase